MINKNNFTLAIAFILIFFSHSARTQDSPWKQSWLKFGAGMGVFRISHDNFTGVYRHRWGDCYGGHAAIRTLRGIHLLGKYKYFQMDGKNGIHSPTGIQYDQANWRETWYNIGLRRYSDSDARTESFFGFGISLFKIRENPEIALFSTPQNPEPDRRGNGFFLELGLQRRLNRFVSGQIEFEITSAGVAGTSILESKSIGGFYLGLGLALEPF